MATTPSRPLIAVVDDEPRNRAVISAFLESEYEIAEAGSGPAALELVERRPVDLVLLDVMMPGLSGFDVCRAIKRRAGEQFLPVVLVTALADQQDRNEGLAAGADEFLTKPVDRLELRLRVRGLLRMRRQEATIRRQLEELERLQAMKDDLVSLVVHDVRNPLAGVVGYLDLLREGLDRPEDARRRADAERALSAAQQLREMLEDVLRIRLVEEGEIPLQPVAARLGDIVREAIASVEGAARRRDVPIEADIAETAPRLLDRRLVRRAVENLISNALKYARSGTPVTVLVHEREGLAEVAVADRGPGVPDALKPALFRKFGSIEAALGHERRGIGLGLHLVGLVAAAHGGSATVSDREGGGAVFRLVLREAAPPAARAVPPKEPTSS
jgi:signal transduction histidine kinase